jgi:hypothetical protein
LEKIRELEENEKKLNYRDLYKSQERLSKPVVINTRAYEKNEPTRDNEKYGRSYESNEVYEKSFNNSNFKEYNDEGYNQEEGECECDEEVNEDPYKKSNLESKFGDRSYSNEYDHSLPPQHKYILFSFRYIDNTDEEAGVEGNEENEEEEYEDKHPEQQSSSMGKYSQSIKRPHYASDRKTPKFNDMKSASQSRGYNSAYTYSSIQKMKPKTQSKEKSKYIA